MWISGVVIVSIRGTPGTSTYTYDLDVTPEEVIALIGEVLHEAPRTKDAKRLAKPIQALVKQFLISQATPTAESGRVSASRS
jgi:hypothetical protein